MIDFDGFGQPTSPLLAPVEPIVPGLPTIQPSQALSILACQHGFGAGLVGGGWSLAVEGPYAGLWVHADAGCRRPSRPNLAKHLSTKGS